MLPSVPSLMMTVSGWLIGKKRPSRFRTSHSLQGKRIHAQCIANRGLLQESGQRRAGIPFLLFVRPIRRLPGAIEDKAQFAGLAQRRISHFFAQTPYNHTNLKGKKDGIRLTTPAGKAYCFSLRGRESYHPTALHEVAKVAIPQ